MRRASARRQLGLTLIELSIVASILMVATVLAAGRFMREVDDAAAQATGAHLLAIKGALDSYLIEHYEALKAGDAVAGFAVALAPTLAELRRAGLLHAGFPDRTPFNQAVAVSIARSPGCPAAHCRLDALAYTTTPLRTPGSPEPNTDLMAQVVLSAGGYGGAAYLDDPATLRGASFAAGNPLGAAAGVVGVLSNLDATPFAQFVRMRDTRNPELQGGLDVQGPTTLHGGMAVRGAAGDCVTASTEGVVDIGCQGLLQAGRGAFRSGGGNAVRIDPDTGIVASQRVHAAQGLATDRGSVFDSADGVPTVRAAAGQMALATGAGVAATVAGQDLVGQAGVSAARLGVREIAVANTPCAPRIAALAGANAEFARSAAGGLMVCAAGIWRELAAMATPGMACAPNGAFATDAGSGAGLVCRLGVWLRADDLFSSYVMVASQVVASGGLVAKPACGQMGAAAGVPLIYLLPQIESSRASSFTRKAEDLGAQWRVSLLDYDGQALGGAARAIAQIYCKY